MSRAAVLVSILGAAGCHVLLPYSAGPAEDVRPEKSVNDSAGDRRSPDVSGRADGPARADSSINKKESAGPTPDLPTADRSRPPDTIPPVDKKKTGFDICIPPDCPPGQMQCSPCPCVKWSCAKTAAQCPQIACI